MCLKLILVFILAYINQISTLSVLGNFHHPLYCMLKSLMEMTTLLSINPKYPICMKGPILVKKSDVARRYQSLLLPKFHYEFHIVIYESLV